MDVILLAAGLGTRLKQKTHNLPKALIEVQGKPLLSYALKGFGSRPWIDQIIVVTGFKREKVQEYLSAHSFSKPIIESFNPDFQKGNLYSVLKGYQQAKHSFLITNVDHIFPTDLLDFCREKMNQVSAVCDFDRKLMKDCMKIRRVLPHSDRLKEIHKKLSKWDGGYIGMTFVTATARDMYDKAAKAVLREKDDTAYAERVLEKLAQDSLTSPYILDASGFGWLEVDTEEDLCHANKILSQHENFLTHGL